MASTEISQAKKGWGSAKIAVMVKIEQPMQLVTRVEIHVQAVRSVVNNTTCRHSTPDAGLM